MPNYIEYQKSISAEFKAYENRVRNIIDDHHWGGRWTLQRNYLYELFEKGFTGKCICGYGFC